MDPRLSNADLAPVPPERRTWSARHIAALWIGMAVCIPTWTLASGLVATGSSWKAAVASVALGNLVVLVPMVLNAHAGTRYGIPFPVLLRAPFGVTGANIPALLRAFVACGWFGIQTWIGGAALYRLLAVLMPSIADLPAMLPAWVGLGTGELLCFLAFWAMNVAIILRGIDSLKALETAAAPLLLAMGVALLVWAWRRTGSLSVLLAEAPGSGGAGFGAVLGAGLTGAVAFWGTLALNIPDFSRFARSQRDQVAGQALGLPATMAFFAFAGAVVTNATAVIFGERIPDPVALLARIGGPAITVLAMLGLTLATLTTNLAANVVSPANDFSNLAPRRISFRRGALITAVIGIVIMPWKLYNDAARYLFAWLLGYGALLGSVGGIMIADYWGLRRCRLERDDLYRRGGIYEYRRGVNPVALVALAIGIAPNIPGFLGALGVLEPGPVFAGIYAWAWFVAFLLGGGSYLGLMTLARKRIAA